jgi:dethiobiotin synthetase
MSAQLIFITATDTNVGKTVATLVLGMLLADKGKTVGVLKPVQCGGNDAAFLKKELGLKDPLETINPCFAKEPLSPHLAFRRAGKKVRLKTIKKSLKTLKQKYDVVLIEGAGGLMVPLKDDYFTRDLIADLKAEVIIVSRLGLGTINHTLMTINQVKAYGLKIKGVLFSETSTKPKAVAEKTNPDEISRLSGVKVLGIIPYLKTKSRKEILSKCKSITVG